MMGKEDRFKDSEEPQIVGPGSYETNAIIEKKGGYIAK